MKIDRFDGKYFFLSNFFPCIITYSDKEYSSAEHLYQAFKANNDEDHEAIRRTSTASMAKKLGRQVEMRQDWEIVKDLVMENVIRLKFAQNPELASRLQATQDNELVEGNWWGDLYWGVDNKTGEGLNKLGQILELIRDEINEPSEAL